MNKAKIVLISLFGILAIIISCETTIAVKKDIVKIQKLEDFQLDGNFREWDRIPFRKVYSDPFGKVPVQNDLAAGFKIAWKDSLLLLYFEIHDDELMADTLFPWKGDAIELFLMDRKGSDHSIQFSIVTGEQDVNKAKTLIQDRRKYLEGKSKVPYINNIYSYKEEVIQVELEIKYDIFLENHLVETVALQIYIDDNDTNGTSLSDQLTWYPVGHSYINTFAAYQLLFTETENSVFEGGSRLVISDEDRIELIIFGAEKGDKIKVRDQQGRQVVFESKSFSCEIPDSIDLTAWEPDLEMDTFFVSISDVYTGMHDLFFAPRRYVKSEPKRFEREIKIFEAKDRLKMPDPGGTVFIGSSSIRMWTTVQNDFPELKVIHRGFGGSISSDALEYMDKIVLPYKPEKIVYYEGDNDIPHGLTNEEIIFNIKRFIDNALTDNQDVEIYLLSPKPSVVRMHLWEKYLSLHNDMSQLADKYWQVEFVNVAEAMFTNGKLMEDLFMEDNLHMNERGYEIWTGVLRKAMNLE